MDPDFTRTALSVPFGEVSQPVLSTSGWHIIRRLDGIRHSPPAMELGPPPPPEMELCLSSEHYHSLPKELITDFYKLFRVVESQPERLQGWLDAIQLYNKISESFTPLTHRLICGLVHFNPGDQTAIKMALDTFDRFKMADAARDLLGRVLVYTWNPLFWTIWQDREKANASLDDRIAAMKETLDSVGFTPDCQGLWVRYIEMMRKNGAPADVIASEIVRALSIGLKDPANLLALLAEFDADAHAWLAENQGRMEARVLRRLEIVRDRGGFVAAGDEARASKLRAFLEEEMGNPLEYDEAQFTAVMDYQYRLVLSFLWWFPPVWMEYWSFLIQHGSVQRAHEILSLGRSAVGDTPLFELRRAEHLMKCGEYDGAAEILANLIPAPEPLRTAAFTMLFKATVAHSGDEAALAVLTSHAATASSRFFSNAAKLCSDPRVAWMILQMGLDTFPIDEDLVIAAAEFLELNRDIRNTRLLFQQSMKECPRQFEIKKKLFQFELDHIAPLDHLNETQKVFKGTRVEPVVLFMQRYRYMDLYPLDVDELRVLGHLTIYGSIDLIDENPTSNDLTTIPPFGAQDRQLLVNAEWQGIANQNLRRATSQDQAQPTDGKPRIPAAIHGLLKQIADEHLHFGTPNVDRVIEVIENFRVMDLRQWQNYRPQMH
jgi:hypothetical protein